MENMTSGSKASMNSSCCIGELVQKWKGEGRVIPCMEKYLDG